ncbi:hypothetical protein KR074_003623 [Drosophila pseudoananassae]|nr:hypothetical protein KR074_003623 [Drosophila pseudoananassae]
MSASQAEHLAFRVEYGTKAVGRSGTVIGLCGKDCVILAVEKINFSNLYEDDAARRIFTIDSSIGMAAAGEWADAVVVADIARQEALTYRKQHEHPIPLKYLTGRVAGFIEAHIQCLVMRPFEVSIVLASWSEGKGPQLYQIEPCGVFSKYHACACGKFKHEARNAMLELSRDLETEELVKSAGAVIYKVHDALNDKNFVFEMGMVGNATNGRLCINPVEYTEMARMAGAAAREKEDGDDQLN